MKKKKGGQTERQDRQTKRQTDRKTNKKKIIGKKTHKLSEEQKSRPRVEIKMDHE